MLRLFTLVITATVIGLLASGRAVAQPIPPTHPHLHHALYEMRAAEKELLETTNDFGGHKTARPGSPACGHCSD